jgi:ribosomal protein L23
MSMQTLTRIPTSRAKVNQRFRVQKLAFMEDEKSTQELQKLVLEAERRSIKLPIIRKAVASAFGVKADQIVILDVVSTAG